MWFCVCVIVFLRACVCVDEHFDAFALLFTLVSAQEALDLACLQGMQAVLVEVCDVQLFFSVYDDMA